jgi:hypothetical protein
MTLIETLTLNSRLRKKFDPITTCQQARQVGYLSLIIEWKFTDEQIDTVNEAFVKAGEDPIPVVQRKARVAKANACSMVNCEYPKAFAKRTCVWHWLLKQPIELQITLADQRRAASEARAGYVERPRVPTIEWPPGERWCSECQDFVPDFYTQGSRCKAHNSRATHASRIKAVYNLDPDEYQALLEWQGGRCYVCGQVPRSQRLAVDHDHATGLVRGLLCANNEWGCNVSLRRLLGDLEMASKALEYVEMSPIDRMRAGQPPPAYGSMPKKDDKPPPAPPAPKPERLPKKEIEEWNPFG